MIDNGLLGFPFGCYFGLVFEACQYPRMHTYELVNDSWWKKYVRLQKEYYFVSSVHGFDLNYYHSFFESRSHD